MTMTALKEWFSAQELAGLPGMPGTDRGVRLWTKKVEKNLDLSRTKVRGKGREYSLKSLPAETQTHLRAQAVAAVLATIPEAPAPAARQLALTAPSGRRLATPDAVAFDGSTEADREQGRAVALVLRKLGEIEAAGARSVKAACHTLIHSARAGLLPDLVVDALKRARDKRGRPSADGLPSTRALELWALRASRGESLVPKKPQPDMVLKLWQQAALELKRRPQKPTTKMVHQQLVANWNPALGAQPPSYDQVAYFFLHKYSHADLLVGQHLGSALAAKRAFKKRTTNGLDPFVEVHADGWNTHFNAPHPVTSEFVTLEVWHFHELATRYVTRPAIGLSESMAVILAGLENYIRELGVPAVWQTDSTGSVKNKTVKDDPVVSIAARAGISIVHPVKVGNSQANGIAENWNTWIDRESRELATYQHPSRMDPLAFRQVRKFTDAMVKAARNGDAEGREVAKRAAQRAGKGLVFESFAQAQDWINARVDKFNNSPHGSLPRVSDPDTGQRRHQTPFEAKAEALAAGFEPVMLDEETLIDLFRMHFRRRVRRAMVTPYLRQEYHHADLATHEGQDVMVAINLMDASRVWVKDLSGRVICEAPVMQVTGYRALSYYEMSLTKRMTAQIKRRENQIEAIAQRMDPERQPLEALGNNSNAQVLPFGPVGGSLNGLDAQPLVLPELTQLGQDASAAAAKPEETAEEKRIRQLMQAARQAQHEEDTEEGAEEDALEAAGRERQRQLALATEQARPAQTEPDEDEWQDGPDRLLLMFRAEQDEIYRKEQEEAQRREAL